MEKDFEKRKNIIADPKEVIRISYKAFLAKEQNG